VLRPIALTDEKKKIIDPDFAFVDFQIWWPGGWSPGTPPPHRAFRLAEIPGCVYVDTELADALATATRSVGRFAGGDRIPADWYLMFPDMQQRAPLPPEPRFARAFHEGDRAAAVKSPRYATWVARSIDGAARPDTRRSAQREPWWAAAYAVLVERKATPAADRAVAADPDAAWLYARDAAMAISPRLAKVFRQDGWSDDDVTDARARLETARRFVTR
jgi:hypothetical protein